MADPATLAAVGAGSAGLGSLIGAGGSLMSGQSQAEMFNYQAAVARLNQQIANQNAQYAVQAGQTQAAESGMQTRGLIGQTIARQGASNIAVGGGSSTAVVASERAIGNINTANILNNAARVAYGYETSGLEAGLQAQVESAAAQQAPTAGAIGALSSLVSGAGSVSSKWLQAGQYGLNASDQSLGG